MARPKSEQPTPAELEVLQLLWESEFLTVREVMDELSKVRPRAYTSVMSLLNVMSSKGLLVREPCGRAFKYQVAKTKEKTLGNLVNDLLSRAFDGSKSALVAQLLEGSNPTQEELEKISDLIKRHRTGKN
ncbi:MAG: BlaI/MecI/CopY family transcriptional regulator [Fuerstiella sp.]